MSTQKSIKIQKNKVLTYSITKDGFKNVYGSVLVQNNQTININLKNLNSETEQYQLGDRLFGISTFVDYFTPSSEYDVDSLKYISASQTTGNSLSNISVVKNTWLQQVEQTLSIETPKGSSNTFIFTFDGTNWQLTGVVTVADISVLDIYNVYGIDYTGTAVSGDVITVVETQYNRFAVFVLDSSYRPGKIYYANRTNDLSARYWYSNSDLPFYVSASDALTTYVSSTICNEYIYANDNLTLLELFRHIYNIGKFILPNNIIISALVPNPIELKTIYNNRQVLDNLDPTLSTSPQDRSLVSWGFSDTDTGKNMHTCIQDSDVGNLRVENNGNIFGKDKAHRNVAGQNYFGGGCCPIFEVPIM